MSDYLERNKQRVIDIFGTDFDNASNYNIAYHCPFCKDRGILKEHNDKKLYVSYQKMKFYCFRCHAKGRISIGIEDSYGVYDKLLALCSPESSDDDSDDSNMFYIPNAKILRKSKAYEYLMSRGFTDEHIRYYDLRLGTNDLFGRIVIPNQIIGDTGIFTDMYSARSYIGQDPKYRNPPGANKAGIVFNLHRIPMKPEKLFIVEGAITAIHAGKDAVATYGCHPSDSQIKMIIGKDAKEYYCNMDNDEAGREPNLKLAEEISTLRPDADVYLVMPPEGVDAADMGEAKYKEFVMDTRQKYHGNIYGKLISVYNKISGN